MKNQPKKRKNELEKLKLMMNYLGRFPILLLGNTGVGKTHWLIEINKKEVKEFKNKIKFINSGLVINNQEYWENELKKQINLF